MAEKKLVTERKPNGLYWVIKYEGGGQLPSALGGLWTSTKKADEAIVAYRSDRAAANKAASEKAAAVKAVVKPALKAKAA